ncbi:hypothetical protein [Paraburkholderia sp.]|nr:hypothetical protein [Paraburkholderia sp.]
MPKYYARARWLDARSAVIAANNGVRVPETMRIEAAKTREAASEGAHVCA